MSKRKPAKPRAPRISACMIVRDEAATIRRALASLSGVDEIVVVDTGSADDTPALATAAGATVVHIPWQENFAAARNESLRRAQGDWILYLDADEELVETQPGELRRLCSQLGRSAGASLTIYNPVNEHRGEQVVGVQWRLFRNVPGVHFEGRVHEQLRWPKPGPIVRQVQPEALCIRHSGYVNSPELIARKGDRNRRLLELSLAEEPDQPAHHFFLGRQYAWERDFEQALPHLERAIALWHVQGCRPDGYVPSMFSTAALAAWRTSQPAKALEIESATPSELKSAELLFVAGLASAALGQTDEAVQRLNRAWQDRTLAEASGSDPSTSSWRPLLAIAEIQEALGRRDQALEAVTKGLDLSPGQPDLLAASTRLRQAVQPLVSACMIVRDESSNLARWLPRVRAAVDELIVVDTGSTDGTAELAAHLGASVHHFEWCDDFAAARNESLRHATGSWILWLDADDELLEASPGALRHLCRSLAQDVHGCWLHVDSSLGADGATASNVRQWRLFRNGLGIQFRGRVHEQASAPPELGDVHVTDQREVAVKHWGYVDSGDMLAGKLRRNRFLLELSMADEPDEPMHHYALGKQDALEQRFQEAAAALGRAMELWHARGRPSYSYVAPMFAVAACAALNLGDNERVLRIEAECPPPAASSDLLYYVAIACERRREYQPAIERLIRAATDPAVATASETDPATATWRPRLLLAQLYNQLQQPVESYRWAIDAVDMMPDDQTNVLLGAARMALRMGQAQDAERIAKRLLDSAADQPAKEAARVILDQAAQRTAPVPA